MTREKFLCHVRSILWRTWSTSGEELASAATETLMGRGMLVPEGGAAELDRLRLLMNAQPAELTEVQIDALAEAGNRAVADALHADLCLCDGWPSACVTGYTVSTWEVGAFDTAMPAVVALWEVMRAAADAAELVSLRARVAEMQSAVRPLTEVQYRDRHGDIWETRAGGSHLQNVQLVSSNSRHENGWYEEAESVERDFGPLTELPASKHVARLRALLAPPVAPLPVSTQCVRCGEGLDDDNVSDFCSDRCAEDVSPQVQQVRELVDRQREDRYESPLRHDYSKCRDFPEVRP